MSHPLTGVRVKIDRAKKHVAELEREIATFLAGNPYSLIMKPDPNTGDQIYCVQIRNPIPDSWAGLVGDIIHNLRSALDQLAVALVIANGHVSKSAISETYFPIGADKKVFSTEKIRRAHPAAIKLIERLKPYKGGITDFWRLHQMDILDKHSLLIPVGIAHTHVGIKFRMKVPWNDAEIVTDSIIFQTSNREYPLKDGATVFRYNIGGGPVPQPGDISATFGIAFGEGQIVDGEPILPTLTQFVDFIERIVSIFAKRFFP